MYANLVNFGLLVKTVAAFGETELKKDHEKWDFKELNYSGGWNTKRSNTKSVWTPNDLKVGFLNVLVFKWSVS